MIAKTRLGVLISGRGTNLQALLDACAEEDFPAKCVVVISNRPEAKGLERARAAGVPRVVVDHTLYPSRETFEDEVHEILREHEVELLANAGFMRILTEDFVNRWRNKHLNIHPSLLPAFKGLDTHARALEAGVKVHGCTVHFVSAGVDDGPIIAQEPVRVAEDDTRESLADRVLEAEHRLYPAVVRAVCEGRVRVRGGRCAIKGAILGSSAETGSE